MCNARTIRTSSAFSEKDHRITVQQTLYTSLRYLEEGEGGGGELENNGGGGDSV